jgi:hypothetical protein
VSILFTVSCAAVPTLVHTPSSETTAAANLADVAVSDGISRDEAEAIASYFFFYHAGVGCGALTSIRASGDTWRIGTKIGFSGDSFDDIVIAKSDGSLMWGRRQCIDEPMEMLSKFPSSCSISAIIEEFARTAPEAE